MRILIRAITHSANVSHTETCSSSRIMHATERFYFFTIKRKHFHTFSFYIKPQNKTKADHKLSFLLSKVA